MDMVLLQGGRFGYIPYPVECFCPFLSRLLKQAGATQKSLSGGVDICVCVDVVNKFHLVLLAQFLINKKTYSDETSH